MLEPNIKEGKGGLRDLQSLFWIAKYVHGVNRIEELVQHGVFTPEEYWAFEQAETFLWAARAHLHDRGRARREQLTFDMQVPVAERLGYTDHSGRRAVEHFMQDYFRHATRVGELTRIFLTALETHMPSASRSSRACSAAASTPRLATASSSRAAGLPSPMTSAFLADNLNMLRLFDEALRTDTLIHPGCDAADLGQSAYHRRRDAPQRRRPPRSSCG